MRARLWSMPVIVVALAAGTAGGLGAAVAAPRRAAGQGNQASVPGAVRSASEHRVSEHRVSEHRASEHRVSEHRASKHGAGEHGAAGRPGTPQAGPAALVRQAAITGAPLVTDTSGGRTKRGRPAPAMTRAMLRANRIMQAAAARYVAATHPAAARNLAGTQRNQHRNYYCGPAMVTEMLAQMKVTLHQEAAARALGTNHSGTDWSNSRGYPVPRVLNARQHRHSYVAVALPWSPTRKQMAVFRTDLISDISHGAPLAGNAYEVPGGPHLVGHPEGQTILHWFDIRGYSGSGAFTNYEDSVHGASSIGWSAGVPAYSTLPTATVAVILGARGYIW